MAGNRKKRAKPYEPDRQGADRRNRPRWRAAAQFLVVLLLAELGLAALAVGKLYSMGFFETLPIVRKLKPGADLAHPDGLEPGGGVIEDGETAGPELNTAAGKTPIYARDPIDRDVVNVLVLGLDTYKPGEGGRSDMNLIVSVDRRQKTVKLASLLRDTLVPIEGHGWNRLNAAYAFGGPGLSINTVNDAFGMDIQRYVRLDFSVIQDIIDAVGGVDIKLTDKEITYLRSYGHAVSKGAGEKHLEGATALAYARIRKIDGDFQRTQRQRNVIRAALKKVRAMGIAGAVDLMTALLPKVKTNMGTGESVLLARQVLAMQGELGQMTVPVHGSFEDKRYNGMDVIAVDFRKNEDALKSFLYGGSD